MVALLKEVLLTPIYCTKRFLRASKITLSNEQREKVKADLKLGKSLGDAVQVALAKIKTS